MSAVLIASGIALAACGSSSSGGADAASSNAPPAAASPVSNSGGLASGASFCTFARAQEADAAEEAQALASDTPARLSAFAQRALAEMQSFTSTAPSAIKADVAIAVAADEKIFAALKKANYNTKNVSPTVFESVDTPAFKKATQDISVYLASRCGISPSAIPTG